MRVQLLVGFIGALAFAAWGCGSDDDPVEGNTGGSNTGGAQNTGGTENTGGDNTGGGGTGGGGTGGGGTGGGGTGGGGGSGGDPGEDECIECISDKCAEETAACYDDEECSALAQCMRDCGGIGEASAYTECVAECADAHPDGIEGREAVEECIDANCSEEC